MIKKEDKKLEWKTDAYKYIEEINKDTIVSAKKFKSPTREEFCVYVWKIKGAKSKYILKGKKVPFPRKIEKNTADSFYEALEEINYLYQEFYFYQEASKFSPYFPNALKIDFSTKAEGENEKDIGIYYEMLQEYGGETLNKIDFVDIKEIFLWMFQSAAALMTLHEMGISHLDIKPSNIVYNRAKKLIKIIDMASCKGYSEPKQMDAFTSSISRKIREYTRLYAPPEVLFRDDRCNKSSVARRFNIGKIDIYCWAKSFYALLLRKTDKELIEEYRPFKNNKESYIEFLEKMKANLYRIEYKDAESKTIADLMREMILKNLNEDHENRDTFRNVVNKILKVLEDKKIYPDLLRNHQESIQPVMKKMLLIKEYAPKDKGEKEEEEEKESEEEEENEEEKEKERKGKGKGKGKGKEKEEEEEKEKEESKSESESKLEQEISDLKEKLKESDSRAKEADKELSKEQDQNEKLSSRYSLLEKEEEKQKKKYKEKKSKLKEALAKSEALIREIKNTSSKKVEVLDKENKRLLNKNEELESKIKEGREQIEKLKKLRTEQESKSKSKSNSESISEDESDEGGIKGEDQKKGKEEKKKKIKEDKQPESNHYQPVKNPHTVIIPKLKPCVYIEAGAEIKSMRTNKYAEKIKSSLLEEFAVSIIHKCNINRKRKSRGRRRQSNWQSNRI